MLTGYRLFGLNHAANLHAFGEIGCADTDNFFSTLEATHDLNITTRQATDFNRAAATPPAHVSARVG